MELAAGVLENQEFVVQLLATSHARLAQSRLLAEKLLADAEIAYHQKG